MAVTVSQVVDINDENTKYLRSYDSIKSTSNLYWTRPGYKFIGWNTEPDGSGTSYVDGAVITFTNDTTLYAMWEEDGSIPPSIETIETDLLLESVSGSLLLESLSGSLKLESTVSNPDD